MSVNSETHPRSICTYRQSYAYYPNGLPQLKSEPHPPLPKICSRVPNVRTIHEIRIKRVFNQRHLILYVHPLDVILGLVLSAAQFHLDPGSQTTSGDASPEAGMKGTTHSCLSVPISCFICPSRASTSRRRAAVAERMVAVSFRVRSDSSALSSERAARKRYACC